MLRLSCLFRAAVIATVLALGAGGTSLAQSSSKLPPGKANPPGLRSGLVPWTGCIPAMGYHYVRPQDKPFGPIYGYYNGKPVFTEIMISSAKLNSGTSWDDQLKPLPGYTINHVDIWWEPHGHPGYLVPHYDIHAWYIPHAAHMTFCGNTSGKKPPFE